MSSDEDTVVYDPDEGLVKLMIRRPTSIYVPSKYIDSYDPKGSSEEPSQGLELEWVYGYRGHDCRNNIVILASGELAYFVAAVGVVFNPVDNLQRHYAQHNDDIKCIAVHPQGKIIATGQVKGRDNVLPQVRIWDSETMETLHVIGTETFNRGVSAVAFNHEDGDLLAAIDDSPEPRLTLWKWNDEEVIKEVKANSDPVLGVTFSKEQPSRLVTFGKNHLAFWNISEDDEFKKSNALFGDTDKPKFITSAASLASGTVVTADSDGNIISWKQGEREIEDVKNGTHSDGIFSIRVTEEGKVITTGKDGKICLYDDSLELLGDPVEIPEDFGNPRVAVPVEEQFLVGTTSNSLIRLNPSNNSDFSVISQGHTDELWGLAVHPSKASFITAGQDSKVHYRDMESKNVLWSLNLEESCQSAAISPSCDIAAVGTSSGKWVIINLEDKEKLFEGQDGDEAIQMIKFSPSGDKIALGSRDCKVYIYGVEDDGKSFSNIASCEGHSSFITHLDWSSDGAVIRTNSGDYELLYWNAEDGSQMTQSEDTKDLEWASNSCILSFETVGIWRPSHDGTDINSANRANGVDLLASGDDFGTVNLYVYPATTQEAKKKSFTGHSSHVTSVIFSHDDTRLISAGGRDTATLQWKVNE